MFYFELIDKLKTFQFDFHSCNLIPVDAFTFLVSIDRKYKKPLMKELASVKASIITDLKPIFHYEVKFSFSRVTCTHQLIMTVTVR